MTVAVAPGEVVARVKVEARNRVAAILPVDQVVRLQDRHPWEYEHRRRHHVIGIAYPYHIGIGKVGVDHRVCVSAVAVVAVPFLRLGRTTQEQGDGEHYSKEYPDQSPEN